MGRVYLAKDPNRPEPVAIKILKPELARNSRARAFFRKEVQHVQRLAHPNILPVLEFKELPESAYLATPYIEPGSLIQWLAANAMPSEDWIIRVMLQVAAALAHAHQHGIIHRDIKPANILVDAQGRACLCDFGLSLSLNNDELIEVQPHHFEGTVHYLSPAVVRGELEDTRSDIYSFGALLYELLARQPPYTGPSREEIQAKILAGPPRPIRELNPQCPPGLAQIVEGAMARELCDRYAAMKYVLADLERVHAGQPPVGPGTHEPSTVVRPWLAWAAVFTVVVSALIFWLMPGGSPPTSSPPRHGLIPIQKLELPGVHNWWRAVMADFNHAGPPEFFLTVENQYQVVSSSGQVLCEWKFDPTAGN